MQNLYRRRAFGVRWSTDHAVSVCHYPSSAMWNLHHFKEVSVHITYVCTLYQTFYFLDHFNRLPCLRPLPALLICGEVLQIYVCAEWAFLYNQYLQFWMQCGWSWLHRVVGLVISRVAHNKHFRLTVAAVGLGLVSNINLELSTVNETSQCYCEQIS